MVNILSGGLHAGRGIDVQDFVSRPTAATSMLEAIQFSGQVRDAATAACAERGCRHCLPTKVGCARAAVPDGTPSIIDDHPDSDGT